VPNAKQENTEMPALKNDATCAAIADLPDSGPIILESDYLYSTLTHPGPAPSLNSAHVNLAYGSRRGDPAVCGTVINASA
jgi:hypothetical protein